MRRAAKITLPSGEPDERLKGDCEPHEGLDQRPSQNPPQRTKDHGPKRIGVSGIEQDETGNSLFDESGIVADERLYRHATDTMAYQDNGLLAHQFGDRAEIKGETFEVDLAA